MIGAMANPSQITAHHSHRMALCAEIPSRAVCNTAWIKSEQRLSWQVLLIAYLHIDEVIRIIREEDDPKSRIDDPL